MQSLEFGISSFGVFANLKMSIACYLTWLDCGLICRSGCVSDGSVYPFFGGTLKELTLKESPQGSSKKKIQRTARPGQVRRPEPGNAQKKIPLTRNGILLYLIIRLSSFVADFRFFTCKFSKVENTGSANMTFFVDFHFLQSRKVYRKNTLNAN